MATDPAKPRNRSRREAWSPGSKYWRDKAEEARTIGAEVRNARIQADMEGIAAVYDRLADQAEREEGGRKPH